MVIIIGYWIVFDYSDKYDMIWIVKSFEDDIEKYISKLIIERFYKIVVREVCRVFWGYREVFLLGLGCGKVVLERSFFGEELGFWELYL